MSALKTWALSVLAWCAMATLAQADSSSGGFSDWTVWSADSGVVSANTGGSPSINTRPDVYLDFGTSDYAEASGLTVGGAQPWYMSNSYTKLFNGSAPSAADQQKFINDVKQDVQTTLEASGLKGNNEIYLTTDPNAGARHAMSIVSHTYYSGNPAAIGITDVGVNGFSFIDKLNFASSLTDLEWAVAHNLSHEIMHALGVGVHPDQTGAYVDAATATWSLLTNPAATLSPGAVQMILNNNKGRNGNPGGTVGGEMIVDGEQEILAPVPEPATIAIWGLAATALILHQRRRAQGRRAA